MQWKKTLFMELTLREVLLTLLLRSDYRESGTIAVFADVETTQ